MSTSSSSNELRSRFADLPSSAILGSVTSPSGENHSISKEDMIEYIKQQNFIRRQSMGCGFFIFIFSLVLLYLYIMYDFNGFIVIWNGILYSLNPGPIQHYDE